MRVLGQQPPALVLDRALHLQRLRDHRGDDAHELHAAVEVALGLEPQIDAERADRLAVDQDRHADEAELLARQLGSSRRAVQKVRLAADPRHDDRLAALDHAAGDAFADAVADALRRLVEAVGRFDVEIALLGQQGDDAAQRAVPLAENLEHAVEGGL